MFCSGISTCTWISQSKGWKCSRIPLRWQRVKMSGRIWLCNQISQVHSSSWGSVPRVAATFQELSVCWSGVAQQSAAGAKLWNSSAPDACMHIMRAGSCCCIGEIIAYWKESFLRAGRNRSLSACSVGKKPANQYTRFSFSSALRAFAMQKESACNSSAKVEPRKSALDISSED